MGQIHNTVKMKKKKLNSTSKEENVAHMKSNPKKQIASKKDKDFGGIPNIDPKRFIGCG